MQVHPQRESENIPKCEKIWNQKYFWSLPWLNKAGSWGGVNSGVGAVVDLEKTKGTQVEESRDQADLAPLTGSPDTALFSGLFSTRAKPGIFPHHLQPVSRVSWWASLAGTAPLSLHCLQCRAHLYWSFHLPGSINTETTSALKHQHPICFTSFCLGLAVTYRSQVFWIKDIHLQVQMCQIKDSL